LIWRGAAAGVSRANINADDRVCHFLTACS
jgi:hypothetical protein